MVVVDAGVEHADHDGFVAGGNRVGFGDLYSAHVPLLRPQRLVDRLRSWHGVESRLEIRVDLRAQPSRGRRALDSCADHGRGKVGPAGTGDHHADGVVAGDHAAIRGLDPGRGTRRALS